MPTLLLGDMKKLQGRDSFSTWKVQMNASLQSQGLWFTVEPGIDYFKDILEHGMMLEGRVQQLKDDERPEAGEARQKLAEVLEGFKAFHARSKEEGKHGEEVVLSRSRVGDVKVTPLKGFSKSHYKTCDEEENVEGYYETPYSSLRDRDDATARFIISTALMLEQMWLVMDQKTARKA